MFALQTLPKKHETGLIEFMIAGYISFILPQNNVCISIRQYNNIDLSSEVSIVHKFVYTDEALLLVRQ